MDNPDIAQRIQTAALVVLSLALGWNMYTTNQLQAELADVRQSLKTQSETPRTAPVVVAPSGMSLPSKPLLRPVKQTPQRGSAQDARQLPDPSETRRVKEQAWKGSQRRQLEGWVERKTERSEFVLAEFVADGRMTRELADETLILLVDELEDTLEIKREMMDGELSKNDAVADYETLRQAYIDHLTEMVGEEQLQLIRAAIRE